MIEIKDLHVAVDGTEILKGITTTIEQGAVVAVMGPNGSGKSTLANALMGDPRYEITSGKIFLDGEDVTGLGPDERAKKGFFLSFQHPSEIPGVTMGGLLRAAMKARFGRIAPAEFKERLEAALKTLRMDSGFADRHVNEGFSGGEKKRAEILQLFLLKPRFAILDETDSGLDVDALRIVGEGIKASKTAENAFLIITHYPRILEYVSPDKVLVIKEGAIVEEGGPELSKKIEQEGFEDSKEA